MPPLATPLRRQLEKTVIEARDVAEKGAMAALEVLGVRSENPVPSPDENVHRLALRARQRSLGEGRADAGWKPLYEEVAYEQWHRMLFGRFLAENDLLIHPTERVPVTLRECAELAETEGEPDEWMVAAKYASAMLPGIFRRDDPSSRIRFATNHRQELEALLNGLPSELFRADDALGWVYQFWQTKAKKEVNESQRKVGGKDLAPVTQLFTEHYMVRFLLENSLGAWWAARHPQSPLLKEWEYLRFRDDGTAAGGTFDGWPATAREVTVMDPCCGSGHFLVAAAEMLRKMRMAEEGLSEGEASAAVLRDNLFGLELDPRCTQIAAFALSFDAWKHGLPIHDSRLQIADSPPLLPNIACTGIAVGGQLSEWTKLAGDDVNLRGTLERLYELFKNAPDLGSLINPNDVPVRERMFLPDYAKVAPLLEAALAKHADDPVAAVYGSDARGAAGAGALLAGKYTLVATNPPFLVRGKQSEVAKHFIANQYAAGRQDLATAFLQRAREMVRIGGSYSLVTPQNWLFLDRYKQLRREFLTEQSLCFVARLGPGAFTSISGEVVQVALNVATNEAPQRQLIAGLDVSRLQGAEEKAVGLRLGELTEVPQDEQKFNPDWVIVLERMIHGRLLSDFGTAWQGISTSDFARFGRCFWEIREIRAGWRRQMSTAKSTIAYGGREHVLFWEDGYGAITEVCQDGATFRGASAWGKPGAAVAQMSLNATLYTGDIFDGNVAVFTPSDPDATPAVWAFCSSSDFATAVRKVNQKMNVTNSAIAKIPFDLDHWRNEAARLYPDGLPQPHSDDPTQWLFRGNIVGSESPLQVAVARLLGYRWPDQPADGDAGIEPLGHLIDPDGIVCLPSVNGEKAAAERLRALLVAAHANPPSGPRPRGATPWPTLPASPNAWIEQLLAEAGAPGKSLEEWLRDSFFEQHMKLFHHRPFIWHIWDGLKDGFSALVNYHRLDHAHLEKLIFVYLAWWIDVQKKGADAGEVGAETRLAAAEKLKKNLELILEGDEPHDIYVRWKATEDQAIGWNPDLDDGVRMNIRPFMTCHPEHPMNVLRKQPNITWKVDRGKDPDGSERVNNIHLSIWFKREARRNVAGGAT